MADAGANFRQQRANRLLTLCAVGKFADAAFECCSPTLNPLVLQQQTGPAFAAGGTIAWVEPLQISPQQPPKIATGLCVRVCAVFQRFAFGRGQVIFDLGFGNDDRIFDIVADGLGYHMVSVPKQPGSLWVVEQLPDPPVTCRARVDCYLSPHSKQVLAFPMPPLIDHCQTQVSLKTYPEGIPVLAQGSTIEKMYFLVADASAAPCVTAEISFQYTRRVLTVKTPQPGQRLTAIHLHDTLAKLCLAADALVFNYTDAQFQNFINANNLRRYQQEDEIMFARRAQQFLAQNFSYVPITQFGKQGGATGLCVQRELDSAGHAVLFVSILRANAVAARVLVGRWVANDIVPGLHYRTEFFADMVGWIPVEPTEKGESLYFGSDAKTPFITSSFGEMTSQFRIQSTTSHAYGANLPPNVTLGWREPTFLSVAGNLGGNGANSEQWTGVVSDGTTSMPNLPGQSHQQPSTQRFAKAHESGAPPAVGAHAGRTYSNSVASPRGVAPPINTSYVPPPVPPRGHEHNSVQVTSFGQPPVLPPHNGGYVQSQVPPALPPHSNQPTSYNGYGQSPMNNGPPPLPPHQNNYAQASPLPPTASYGAQNYGQAPPPLPPHQQISPPQHAGQYGQSNSNLGAPPLPQHQYGTQPTPNAYNPQGAPMQQPPQQAGQFTGYGNDANQQGFQQAPPPQLPPHQQLAPPQQNYGGAPPDQGQYQQYQQPISPQPTTGAVPPGMPSGPTVVQPRPISMKPQQHLQQLEASQAAANAGNANSAAPPKSGIKVAVLPPGPVKGTQSGPTNATGAAGAAPKAGAAKVWPPKQAAAKPAGPGNNAQNANGGAPKGAAPSLGGVKKVAAGVPKAGTSPPSKRVFARATFDHVPQDHLELALTKGDVIEILNEDNSGWWKAEKLGKLGIVPAPYIEKLGPQSRVAKAVFPFEAQEASDLGLKVGEFAVVLSSDGDWWEAEAHGNRGSVPNNYVQFV